MTSAAAYVRISQDREGEGLGVARQQEDCVSFIRKHGWDLTEVYVDNDVSAFSGRCRPAYERLMTDIKAGTVDAVVAWHPDRLHRSPRELEDFIETIERTRTTVATVTAGDYDLSTPDGRLMARIVGSVARKESEDKSRRLRRKHQELAERGKLSGGGRRPFGFETDRVTLRAEEAEAVRDAAQRVLAGETLTSIINDWNAREISTVTGAHWSTTTLKRLLRSGRISGQREHDGRIVAEAEWPAIITPEQTQALRSVLDDRARDRSTREARSYLLSGFVWCGRCGTRMTTRPTGRGVPRYICAKSRGGCGRCGIAAEGLERLVTDATLAVFDSPDFRQALQQVEERGDDTGALLARITEDERALEQLAQDHYVERIIGRSEHQAARRALEDRIAENRRQLAEQSSRSAVGSLVVDLDGLADRWPDMSLGQRRALIGDVIERIVIAPTERSNNRFDEGRVDVEWKV